MLFALSFKAVSESLGIIDKRKAGAYKMAQNNSSVGRGNLTCVAGFVAEGNR
jgi:hypothetical protein